MNSQAIAVAVAGLVGILIGGLAELVLPNPRWGMAGSLLVGAAGALLGGTMLKAGGLRLATGTRLGDAAAIASVGAILVLVLARLMGLASAG